MKKMRFKIEYFESSNEKELGILADPTMSEEEMEKIINKIQKQLLEILAKELCLHTFGTTDKKELLTKVTIAKIIKVLLED